MEAVVAGTCDPAFSALGACFAELVREKERGAVAVRTRHGSVVDLRAGPVDPVRPEQWAPDTLACCFSVTKGVCSLGAHALIDQGRLDPDWPVARLWPEFSAGGKSHITVGDLLTHRAGLPAVSTHVSAGDLYDAVRMRAHLAASEPVVPPRVAPVYHNMTYGYLVGEILCRASGHRDLRTALRQLVSAPLGADFAIGLTANEQARCATLVQDDPDALQALLQSDTGTLLARSMAFFAQDEDFNSARWRSAQIGSGSGHATADALARLYGALIFDNEVLSTQRQREARTLRAQSAGLDPVMEIAIRYGEGFELSNPPWLDFGPGDATVGHWGAGGATALADPDAGVVFAYVTGNMSSGFGSSARCRSLVAALYECL